MRTFHIRKLAAVLATTALFATLGVASATPAGASTQGLTTAQSARLAHSPVLFDIGRRLH